MRTVDKINPLPGVPLVESPFFERLFAPLSLDHEARRIAADLREHGYAVLDFPEPEFDRISAELKRKFVPDGQAWDGISDLRVQDAWRFDANVKRIATNKKILDLLETLYGRPAFPFQTLNFPVGSQQRIHSDNVHFSSVPDGFMCGVWVALEDVDADNGPLVYYPGSHKWPNYFNEHIGVNCRHLPAPGTHYRDCENLWSELAELYKATPERFFARKGQALIWLAHLWHGGDRHRDVTRTRHSQVTHYFFERCCYYTPMHSEPFSGVIHFREVENIATGAMMPNILSGHRVPKSFMAQRRLINFLHHLKVRFLRRARWGA